VIRGKPWQIVEKRNTQTIIHLSEYSRTSSGRLRRFDGIPQARAGAHCVMLAIALEPSANRNCGERPGYRKKRTTGQMIAAQPSRDVATITIAPSPTSCRLTRAAPCVRSAINASLRSKSSIVIALSFPMSRNIGQMLFMIKGHSGRLRINVNYTHGDQVDRLGLDLNSRLFY
jgi:hypothetical protein